MNQPLGNAFDFPTYMIRERNNYRVYWWEKKWNWKVDDFKCCK